MSIAGINHALSSEVKASLENLQFDLRQWDQNPRIGGLLSQTVLSGGKRLRPLLTLLVADLFGVSHQEISPFARVVELVHAATLAHDDVIDNATLRRGHPSINMAASNKKAVLAGDYLLAYSLQEVAQYQRPHLVTCLAEIIRDLAEGEWLQMENSTKDILHEEDVELVALKKTGSVLRWCTQAAPLYQEQSASIVEKAREFGESLGVAFQMTDDILDFKRKDGAEFADIKNRVINSVIFTNICLSYGTKSINTRAMEKIEINKDYLETAINQVRSRVTDKLDRCKKILLEFMDLPVASARAKKREESFFALSCVIEYLVNRV